MCAIKLLDNAWKREFQKFTLLVMKAWMQYGSLAFGTEFLIDLSRNELK